MSYGRARGLCDAPTFGVTSTTCALSAPRVSSLSPAFSLLSICGDSGSGGGGSRSAGRQAGSLRLHPLWVSLVQVFHLLAAAAAAAAPAAVVAAQSAIIARTRLGICCPCNRTLPSNGAAAAVEAASSLCFALQPSFHSVRLAVTRQQSTQQEGGWLAFVCSNYNHADDDDGDGHSLSRKENCGAQV